MTLEHAILQQTSYGFIVLKTTVGQGFVSGNTHAVLLEGVHYILHLGRLLSTLLWLQWFTWYVCHVFHATGKTKAYQISPNLTKACPHIVKIIILSKCHPPNGREATLFPAFVENFGCLPQT